MSQHKGRALGPPRPSSVQLEELDWVPPPPARQKCGRVRLGEARRGPGETCWACVEAEARGGEVINLGEICGRGSAGLLSGLYALVRTEEKSDGENKGTDIKSKLRSVLGHRNAST